MGDLANTGSPATLPIATLEAVDTAGFTNPGELRRALLLAQAWTDSDTSAEALARYAEARRWETWMADAPAPAAAVLGCIEGRAE